jgi:hypothetical protein
MAKTANQTKRQLSIKDENTRTIGKLAKTIREEPIALYLGSGVSKGSDIPLWKELVARLYVRAVAGNWTGIWEPLPNYLSALGEWTVENSKDSPEILSQKIAMHFSRETSLRDELRKALYADWMTGTSKTISPTQIAKKIQKNSTLAAIKRLLDLSVDAKRSAVYAIVTYNYDDLIERLTQNDPSPFVAMFKSEHVGVQSTRPCLHVHGYLPPLDDPTPSGSKLIFTEAEYHDASNEPYSWSNLCQIECMARYPGLMIGLSLTDRNMRRLMRALKSTPLKKPLYAILTKPEINQPDQAALDKIHQRAIDILESGLPGAAKKGERRDTQIKEIFSKMAEQETAMQRAVLKDLGINPIIVDRSEIGTTIDSIINEAAQTRID